MNVSPPIRMSYSVELAYQVNQPGADFVLNVHAARTASQRVVSEHLEISPPMAWQEYVDPASSSRLLRLRADTGKLVVRYHCAVDLDHVRADPSGVPENWICNLPGAVLPYLYPSRYCESDTLNAFAREQFGSVRQGYTRVQMICEWVQRNIRFVSGSSGGTTTAAETLAGGEGVCRDFAHLMSALCRALNVPARFATGLDYGADPELGPTDFHAYVEVYLGTRWYIFDPSGTAVPMGLVRLASGRDASDCAYATIFGDVTPLTRWLTVQPTAGGDGQVRLPFKCAEALSTDSAALA
ncbi:transglutaminase family protein [Ramlibacter henchirensis]|uniref:Transglutaminase family protein n=1 Tax=Ramlibacter henchirensis TaxID=204072 RepID=A0A4Z0C6L7_9BURK|nr:transglutaminase family protein [Ramlibacter henchirensis]TFZ06120.1 transglutaminase family protein [Ramlibacter henchirensis]